MYYQHLAILKSYCVICDHLQYIKFYNHSVLLQFNVSISSLLLV